MDAWILLLTVLIAVVIVAPVVSLVKMFSIDSRLREIERELKRLKTTESEISSVAVEPQVPETEEAPQPVTADVEEPGAAILDTAVQKDTELSDYAALVTDDGTSNTDDVKKKAAPFRFENLLSKIGIITLVLGVAFFVKYAIDKEWINEVGRVAIGVLTGGILIGIAHKLRGKYNLFSALLVGGGISVLYITVTLAFREYHLFSRPLAFIILIAITVFSVILSLVYDRKELALFSLLGGYASPLMVSAGESSFVVLFAFLFILNSGMLIISMRKRWRIIGIVSFVCTLLFYWVWLMNSFESQYTGALTFGILFFVQFYLLALFDHFLSDRKISPFQVCVILTDNLSLFVATVYIFNGTGMKVQGLITFAMALINAVAMIALFRKVDKRLLYLIIAIVVSFVSLAAPVQFGGHVITLFWAAEIVILLRLWQQSGIKVFHTGFLLISGLTLISYFIYADPIYFHLNDPIYLDPDDPLPVIFNRVFITGMTVVAAFAVSRFMLGKASDCDNGIIRLSVLKRILTVVTWGMGYLVTSFELYCQFENSAVTGVSLFTPMALVVYTTLYTAVMGFVFRHQIRMYGESLPLLFIAIILGYIAGLPMTIELRSEIIAHHAAQYDALFMLHYLSLPALAYLFYLGVKSILHLSKEIYTFCGWLFVIGAVVILSVELDNVVAQLWATPDNYQGLMYEVHTVGYPILWGILALILMIRGLKAKEALLRQISLGFFAFILLKFYIGDIWRMSQTGRIISFVVLGIILLLVSFLMQKIKGLIREDEAPAESGDSD
jgi:uncharacterized membrane protein